MNTLGHPVWCCRNDTALRLKGTEGKMAVTLSPMLYSKSDLSSLMPACSCWLAASKAGRLDRGQESAALT